MAENEKGQSHGSASDNPRLPEIYSAEQHDSQSGDQKISEAQPPPSPVPWDRAVQLGVPESASDLLDRPKPQSSAASHSSVVNDLGNAKYLANNRASVHAISNRDSQASVDELVAFSGAGFTDSGGSLALWGVELPSQADATQQEELDEANRESQSADRETLGESIRAACEVSRTRDKGKFLPNDALESIVTRERVREELSNHKLGQPAHLEYLADEIWDVTISQGKETTRRRIFAILGLIEKCGDIVDFIQNDLYDKDLPFILSDEAHPGRPQLCRKRKNGTTEPIQFLNKWRIPVRESFDNNQWQLLAPYFTLLTESNRTVSHYPLADRIILPLIESDEVKQGPGHAEGGYGDVWRVKIHPFHHNCCKNTDDSNENPSYAVKRLHHSNKEAFDVEVSNLKRFSAKDHVHLIKLLVTFSWRDQYYLLFPWADENLLTFWKSLYPEPSYPPRDHNLAAWFSKECLGIAHGLQMIHTAEIPSSDRQPCETSLQIHGRHGDLKPENILWFKSYEGTEQGKFGVLKISDFGLTRFHGTQSKSHFENVAVSATYRPPEFDVAMMVSQGFDIWSLGCVLLEFVTWYLLGGAGVEKFSSDRAKDDSREIHQDVFFNFVQIKEKNGDLQLGARAKQSVVNEFQTLYQQENLSDFMLDLLTFIKDRLLRVRPQNRANCKEIVEKFEAFHKECLNNPIYCTKRFKKIPERTGTGLSELSASTVHLSKAKTDQINRNNLPEHKGPLEDDIPSSQPSSSSSIGSQPDTRTGYGSMMRSVSPERLQSSFRGSPIMRSVSPERIQSGLKGKAPEKMGTVPEERTTSPTTNVPLHLGQAENPGSRPQSPRKVHFAPNETPTPEIQASESRNDFGVTRNHFPEQDQNAEQKNAIEDPVISPGIGGPFFMNMSLSGSSEFPLPNPIRREDRNLAVYSETGFGSTTGQRQPDSTIYASDVQTDKAVTGDDVAENGGLHSLLQPSSNLPDPEHDANHEVNVDDAENASANTETGDASPSGVMAETLEPSQPQRQNNCLNEGANGKEPHVPDNSQGQNGKSKHTQGRTSVKKSRSKKFLKGVKHFFSRLFRRERSKKRKLRPLNPDKT